MCGVFIAPAGEHEWGDNWLDQEEHEAILPHSLVRFGVQPGSYDVRADLCGTTELDRRAIDVRRETNVDVPPEDVAAGVLDYPLELDEPPRLRSLDGGLR